MNKQAPFLPEQKFIIEAVVIGLISIFGPSGAKEYFDKYYRNRLWCGLGEKSLLEFNQEIQKLFKKRIKEVKN